MFHVILKSKFQKCFFKTTFIWNYTLPSGQHSPSICLYTQSRSAYLCVSHFGQPTANVLLNKYSTFFQTIRPQLFKIRHLTSTEEYLCLAKLVFVSVLELTIVQIYYDRGSLNTTQLNHCKVVNKAFPNSSANFSHFKKYYKFTQNFTSFYFSQIKLMPQNSNSHQIKEVKLGKTFRYSCKVKTNKICYDANAIIVVQYTVS